MFALASIFILHILHVMTVTYPESRRQDIHTWRCAFHTFLLCAPPCMVATSYAAWKLEDVYSAYLNFKSWSVLGAMFKLAPYPLAYMLYYANRCQTYGSQNSNPLDDVGDNSTNQAIDKVTVAYEALYFGILIGVLEERNGIDWIQVAAFTALHVYIIGPKRISLYPVRLYNWSQRKIRRSEYQVPTLSFHRPSVMWTTVALCSMFVTISIVLLSKLAFHRDAARWIGPAFSKINTKQGLDVRSQLDMVLIHSFGDSAQSIADTISTYTSIPALQASEIQFYIYTQDMDTTRAEFHVRSSTIRPIALPNIGGETALILHHIIKNWESLATQTIFLSTSSSHTTERAARLKNFFIPSNSKVSTTPATGFLNLGDSEICICGNCYDSYGWQDTFGLVPSMWSAARSGYPYCSSVLLTHGNNFVASADRIRGTPKETWSVLYDALVNADLRNSWAHEPGKLGHQWKKINGYADSLERPFLGYTVERLWGILLQCSNKEIAWNCANMARGWRRGGGKDDCQCID